MKLVALAAVLVVQLVGLVGSLGCDRELPVASVRAIRSASGA